MNRPMVLALLGIGLVGAAVAGGAPGKAAPKGTSRSKSAGAKAAAKPAAMQYPFQSVTLEIHHRVFHDFKDKEVAKPGEIDQVGDTEYTFRVNDYVPEFVMDLKNHKIMSRSPDPRNPAFQIIVNFKGKAQDTTWALLNMPPHFARKSLLAFQILRIDFADRPSIVAPDEATPVVPSMPPAKGALKQP